MHNVSKSGSPGDAPAADGIAASVASSVLIVEDDALLAMYLCQALEKAGQRVIGPCFTYRDALARIERDRPRCAVIDIDLGRGDLHPGFEGERILAILTSAGCRCVVHSGRIELFATIGQNFPDVVVIAKPAPADRIVEALLAPGG